MFDRVLDRVRQLRRRSVIRLPTGRVVRLTKQIGQHGRSVQEIAEELGGAWRTVNDALLRYGEVLVDEEHRFGDAEALGLDEVLFAHDNHS